ncbi:MAG TPA: hypothetical protein VD994_15635 [Prosthecobacter sp.]|nr:hypothetical protein [Prosthecobacter sp.]
MSDQSDPNSGTNRIPIGDSEDEIRDFISSIRRQQPEASEAEVRHALDAARSDASATQSRFWLTEKVLEILSVK